MTATALLPHREPKEYRPEDFKDFAGPS